MLDLGSGGMWKNFRANPGDERSWRVLQCNKHVDCGKLLRIVLHKSEGLFYVEHSGAHTENVKDNQRKGQLCPRGPRERAMERASSSIDSHTSQSWLRDI